MIINKGLCKKKVLINNNNKIKNTLTIYWYVHMTSYMGI